jgi:hypothetical protein
MEIVFLGGGLRWIWVLGGGGLGSERVGESSGENTAEAMGITVCTTPRCSQAKGQKSKSTCVCMSVCVCLCVCVCN